MKRGRTGAERRVVAVARGRPAGHVAGAALGVGLPGRRVAHTVDGDWRVAMLDQQDHERAAIGPLMGTFVGGAGLDAPRQAREQASTICGRARIDGARFVVGDSLYLQSTH